VLVIITLPTVSSTSHVQPEPKLPTALAVNSSLNLAKLPKDFLIASASFPFGSPPPFGDKQSQ